MSIDRFQGRAARGKVGLLGSGRWAIVAVAWLMALSSAACSDEAGQGGNSQTQDVFFGNLPDVSADFARPLARRFRPAFISLESGLTARNPIQHPGENV